MQNYEKLLSEHLVEIACKYPDKPAYIISDAITTYSEMYLMAQHIASGIVAALAEDGDHHESKGNNICRIGISLPKNTHYISCIFATTMLHCSYVPIDVFTPIERKRDIIDDAGIRFMIDESNIDTLISSPIMEHLPDLSIPEYSEAYIIYTSGTTGRPKGVSISYKALYSFLPVISLPDRFNYTCSSRILQFASISFDASVMEIFPSLFNGATLIVATEEERLDSKRLYELMIRQHVTFVFLSPSLVTVLPSYDFPDLDTMTVGGEAMPPGIPQQIVGKHGYRLLNVYGPTENTAITTSHEILDANDYHNIGTTLPGIRRIVIDTDGKQVERGTVGELIVGGPQLATCYWNRPENNAAAFEQFRDEVTGEEWRGYHTGDLVSENEDGSFNYQGRIGSQVKLHSFRIELQEIVTRIEAHPRVCRAYCRLEKLGNDKYLVAYVQTTDGNADFNDIKEYARRYMPPYMIPTFWNHVDTFTLNINGKIDKATLVNHAWQLTHQNTREATNSEQILINVVNELLATDDINIDADLITEVGLTSLQIMQIPSLVENTGMKVTVEDIYTHRTISKIAGNHLYRLSFWYTDPEEHPERPVIIYFCGHPHFGYFNDILPLLAKTYNIFIVESFHFILHFSVWTTPELIKLYELLIAPIHEQYNVVGYCGYCIGGEQALCVAYNLFTNPSPDSTVHKKPGIKLPHVVVFDGEVLRDKEPSHFIPVRWPSLTEKQNDIRQEMDITLISTYPDENVYHGPVTAFLSDKFADQWTVTPEEMDLLSEECIEANRYQFNINPQKWAKTYPHATVKIVDADHFTFMHDPTLIKLLIDYINEHIK